MASMFVIGLSVFERSPSSFHLLGLDFMITDDLKVWFIEANSYPLWPRVSSSRETSFIDELMETMGVRASLHHQELHDYIAQFLHFLQNSLFDLLFELRENPTHFHEHLLPGQYFKSLQLVWSEIGTNCRSDHAYNPCSEF